MSDTVKREYIRPSLRREGSVADITLQTTIKFGGSDDGATLLNGDPLGDIGS